MMDNNYYGDRHFMLKLRQCVTQYGRVVTCHGFAAVTSLRAQNFICSHASVRPAVTAHARDGTPRRQWGTKITRIATTFRKSILLIEQIDFIEYIHSVNNLENDWPNKQALSAYVYIHASKCDFWNYKVNQLSIISSLQEF